MGFWKLLCSIWAFKKHCRGFRWNFSGMPKKTFQEALLIPVHAVTKGNHKAIINEGFHHYLNKVQNIKLADKGTLQKWLQGVFFHCMLEMKSQ